MFLIYGPIAAGASLLLSACVLIVFPDFSKALHAPTPLTLQLYGAIAIGVLIEEGWKLWAALLSITPYPRSLWRSVGTIFSISGSFIALEALLLLTHGTALPDTFSSIVFVHSGTTSFLTLAALPRTLRRRTTLLTAAVIVAIAIHYTFNIIQYTTLVQQ